MVINIETKRLTMRQLSDEDWSLYYKLQTDFEIIDLCFDERSETDIKTGFDSRLPNLDNRFRTLAMLGNYRKRIGK